MSIFGYAMAASGVVVCFVIRQWKRNSDARDKARKQLMSLIVDSQCANLGLTKIMASGLLKAGIINGETELALENSQEATLALKRFLQDQGVKHVF